MLVMEAAGAGEEEFPRCMGAGDFETRCCLGTDPLTVSVLNYLMPSLKPCNSVTVQELSTPFTYPT